MRNATVRRNLFTYLGFALDAQSFEWEDRLSVVNRATLDNLLITKQLLTKPVYPKFIAKTDVRVLVVGDFASWIKNNV